MILSFIYMSYIGKLAQSFQNCKPDLGDLEHILDKSSQNLDYFIVI